MRLSFTHLSREFTHNIPVLTWPTATPPLIGHPEITTVTAMAKSADCPGAVPELENYKETKRRVVASEAAKRQAENEGRVRLGKKICKFCLMNVWGICERRSSDLINSERRRVDEVEKLLEGVNNVTRFRGGGTGVTTEQSCDGYNESEGQEM